MHDPNSYMGLGWLLVALAALAMGINQVMGLVDRFREKPPASELYVPFSNCKLHRQVMDTRLSQMECAVRVVSDEAKKDRDFISTANEARSVALHNRLNEIQQVGTAAESIASLTNQRITQLDMKTDNNFKTVIEMIGRNSK